MSTQLMFAGDWAPVVPRNEKIGNSFSVANLECAFADGAIASEKAYSSVLPRACMSYIPSGGFSALSVANNHVNDTENFQKNYDELVRRFPEIQFFGVQKKPYAEFDANGKKIFVIGCLESCRSRGSFIFKQEDVAELIKSIRYSYSPSSSNVLIYVYPHWGKEGEYTRFPAPWQLRLARKWIDTGADGVFGSHSHVPQGREWYNGKPIYYSLGNFEFDHPESKLYEGTSEQMIIELDVNTMRIEECFSSDSVREAVEMSSSEFASWNIWTWAKKIGPFNLQKNTASWKVRLRKNFVKTLPKFLIWQIFPQTLLFRIASLCR